MLRGFVKNCASAIDAFGYFVSALTEMPIEPLPTTPDLPTGAGTTARLSYRVGLFDFTTRMRFGAVCQNGDAPLEKVASPSRSIGAVMMSVSTRPLVYMSTYIWSQA